MMSSNISLLVFIVLTVLIVSNLFNLSLLKSPFLLKQLNSQSRGVQPARGMFTLFAALLSSAPACFRTRAALQAEILALRDQLLVLQRSNSCYRLRFGGTDRLLWFGPHAECFDWRWCFYSIHEGPNEQPKQCMPIKTMPEIQRQQRRALTSKEIG